MVGADATIVVYNARIGSDRREIFHPTVISGVTFTDVRSSRRAKGVSSEELHFSLRIPISAKVQNKRLYVREADYKEMPEESARNCWTLRKGDYILVLDRVMPTDEPLTLPELSKLPGDLVRIVEYADNTREGSVYIRHWRIGGA